MRPRSRGLQLNLCTSPRSARTAAEKGVDAGTGVAGPPPPRKGSAPRGSGAGAQDFGGAGQPLPQAQSVWE